MDKGYLDKRDGEQRTVLKSSFWKDFLKEAFARRAIISRRCEIDKADQRFYQGQLEMFDTIFGRASETGEPREGIPEKMLQRKK